MLLCYIIILFPQHRLWVSLTVRASVFVPHCWFSSFRTPRIRRGLSLLSGPLPITDLVLPSFLGGDFHYTTIITKFFMFFFEILIFFMICWTFFLRKGACGKEQMTFLTTFHLFLEILIFSMIA